MTQHRSDFDSLSFVTSGRWKRLSGLGASAFIGGISEATFLVVVTRLAFAVTDGADQVGTMGGWYLDRTSALLLSLMLIAARLGFALLAAWQGAVLGAAVIADVRRRLTSAFVHATWRVQQAQRSGSLQELLTTFTGQAGATVSGVAQAVLTSANLVALLGIAIAVDPGGAVLIAVSVGILGTLLRPLRSAVRRRSEAATRAGMDFATSVNEVSRLGLELHAFHVQDAAEQRVARRIEEARRLSTRLNFAAGLTSPLYASVAYLALVAALAAVAASNSASLTSLGAVMLIMLRSLGYGQALQSAYTTVTASHPAMLELRTTLERLEDGRRHDGELPVGAVGDLRAESVSFSYTPGQEVLRDLTFTVGTKEIVGVIGPSGGGKSTLVQLLLGVRNPDTGRILSNGQDIRELRRSEWARKVTFVPQDAHLIDGSIADNIRFLRDDVSDSEIERAARLAHVHDEIAAFPDGYDRIVGGSGARLSGGQLQRLCIARALVERPDVLILDEPTSALDVRSEHLIRTTLLGLRARMAVIVIAHRLSTLDICDRLMVIQEGELRAFATPDELRASSAFYREALSLSGLS